MDLTVIPSKLDGVIHVSGNKNAALPVIAASLMVRGKVTLYHIPDIIDVNLFLDFLQTIGVKVNFNKKAEILDLDYSSFAQKRILRIKNPGNLSKIRAVILLLAGLIARFDKVSFGDQFSGCDLGTRPLTVHFDNLRKLGVNVKSTPTFIELDGTALKNQKKESVFIWQDQQSVTATEVAMILAAAHKVKTTIYNAASEPHVQDLARFLVKLGAKITGVGTNKLVITPATNKSKKPEHIKFAIRSDHHEIATFLAISALAKGNIKIIHNFDPELLKPIESTFNLFGYTICTKPFVKPSKFNISSLPVWPKNIGKRYISYIKRTKDKPLTPLAQHKQVKPHPWPGLPVDILPLFVPLAAHCSSPTLFHNWMYDGALFWTLQLRKAGVNVFMADPHRVLVSKGRFARPSTFEAPYIIRAVIAFVIYALSLSLPSKIRNADPIFRAHPFFVDKLEYLGAKFEVER